MRGYGADVVPVDGLIDDAGRLAAEYARDSGAFNCATFREPYRVEGKKTMAYELVEQLGGVPGTIVYPTGGGTGLVAMWKAFDELEALGWIGTERPVMVCVQADGCAPIVRGIPRRRGIRRTGRKRHDGDVGFARSRRNRRSAVAPSTARVARARRCRLRRSRRRGDARTPSARRHRRDGGGRSDPCRPSHLARRRALPAPIVLFNTATSLKYAPRAPIT